LCPEFHSRPPAPEPMRGNLQPLLLASAVFAMQCLAASAFSPIARQAAASARSSGTCFVSAAHLTRLIPRAPLGAAAPGRRGVSGLRLAKGSIAGLYQAKGRTPEELTAIASLLAKKGYELDTVTIIELDKKRKALNIEMDGYLQERNAKSKSIGKMKANGEDTTDVMAAVEGLKGKLQASEHSLKEIQEELDVLLAGIPNAPHSSVPEGEDEEGNVEVRKVGEPGEFSFEVKDHVDVAEGLLGMDFAQGVKIAGTRFVLMRGDVAWLHRALAQFMLDTHTGEHGYEECYTPYIVNSESLMGTGQLPKFKEDLYSIDTGGQHGDMYLIPTSEVTLTNTVRDTILQESELPIKLTAHTPCFRSEAGSYGRDTRGLIRQHQFDKVEMVQIVRPEESYKALEEITGHAEVILKALKLPYKVMELCTGDLGFSAAKTFDLEVWLPAQQTYREISSCSNCEDFQARRLMARFKNAETKSNENVHTLNGSGLAVGRTLCAVLENYQQEDGSVEVPEVLRPYMGGKTHIRPPAKPAKKKEGKGGAGAKAEGKKVASK